MFMKTKGEHNCGSCKCISNVIINRGAYALASAVCVVSLLIVVLYTITGDHSSFMGIACVLAPFVIFYLTIPFFVKLVPCKDKSAVNRILEKQVSAMPNDTAFQAIQNATKPVTLDVEDDFSARFMRAKKSNIEKKEAVLADPETSSSDGEPEDIHNSMVEFEITENDIREYGQDNEISSEQSYGSEGIEGEYPEASDEAAYQGEYEPNAYQGGYDENAFQNEYGGTKPGSGDT